MHTTLFAAIMAGSTGKQGFSDNRQAPMKNKESDPQERKTLPSGLPSIRQNDRPAQVRDSK